MAQQPTLNHRVRLERPDGLLTNLGQPSGNWVPVAEVFAHVSMLRARELFAAGQANASTDVRVILRHRDDVAASWRVVPLAPAPMAGKPLALQGDPISINGHRSYLELLCQSGVRDGR